MAFQQARTLLGSMQFVGRVVSAGEMNKTAKVLVERTQKHARTSVYYTHRKKFLVHDEDGQRMAGDVVRIENCPPYSKMKRFKIIEVIREAERFTNPETGAVTTPFSDPVLGFPKKKGWKYRR